MAISVIISTYNSPDWLEKALWGYKYQTFTDFEVIIADDGSTSETANAIKRIQNEVDFLIKHVWHEDIGFRKCEIMNLAIQASTYDYLVFSDGDRATISWKHIKECENPIIFYREDTLNYPCTYPKE